jgi:hypothetical protein
MSKIVASLELKNVKDTTWSMLQRIYQQTAKTINGGLSFGDGTHTDNISGFWTTQTPALANTDFTVTHNLHRLPAGYLAMEKSAACDVFTGSVAPTTTQITLRASVGGVTLRIFIF